MNQVNFTVEEVPPPVWEKRAKAYILKVLRYLEKDKWELSVLFCGNNYIRQLNLKYRNRDEATDVLSFALGEDEGGDFHLKPSVEHSSNARFLPGDIAISLEMLNENAAYFNVEPDEELRRLLIHGILHLSGMDHATNKEEEPMLQLQEKIVAELAGEHII